MHCRVTRGRYGGSPGHATWWLYCGGAEEAAAAFCSFGAEGPEVLRLAPSVEVLSVRGDLDVVALRPGVDVGRLRPGVEVGGKPDCPEVDC